MKYVSQVFGGILFLLVLAGWGFSQDTLSLSDCVRIALERNPELASEQESYLSERAGFLDSWSGLLPDASLSGGYSHFSKESMRISGSGFESSDESYSTSFSASWNIFRGGSDVLGLLSDRSSVSLARLSYHSKIRNIISNVKRGYLDILRYQALLVLADSSLVRAKAEREFIEEKNRLGAASELELAQARVEEKSRELSLIQARNNLNSSKEHLNFLLGIPADTVYTVVLDTSLDIKPPPLEECIQIALDSSCEYRSALISEQIARRNYLATFSSFLPGVNLNYSYSWNGSSPPGGIKEIKDEGYSSVGLSVSLPVFEGLSRLSRTASARHRYLEAHWRTLNTRASVEESVRSIYRRIQETDASLSLSRMKLEEASHSLQLAWEMYRLGSISYIELVTSELDFVQSKSELIESRYNYLVAVSELELYTGKLY
ncbi:MAG: hypothetical protein B6D65_03465 [candidate division Zixibacteria bacterium 4484_93]|nr:MAG: hypothetical protein B6D65_03465 [candidate division Zixibacteria bacterium 4484_93]